MHATLRLLKMIGAVTASTVGGAIAGLLGILPYGLLFQRGEGFIGDGIPYLFITLGAATIGLVAGLIWASDIASAGNKASALPSSL